MIVCPLCENQQAAGTECDVCGRPLPAAEVAAAGHTDPPPPPPPEGFEPTQVASEAAGGTPPLAPDAPCVWCGHRQAAGQLCDRCGMQRHRGRRPGGVTSTDDEPEVAICRECGLPGPPGGRCKGCGAKMPAPEGA